MTGEKKLVVYSPYKAGNGHGYMAESTMDQSGDFAKHSLMEGRKSKVSQINPLLDEKVKKFSRAMMLYRQATICDDQKRVSIELK